MAKKFNNLEEVQEKRQELEKEFDDGLPDYLVDYFDNEEHKKLNAEYWSGIYKNRKSFTPTERYEFKKEKTEEFWNENNCKLVKVRSNARTEYGAKYEDAPIAEERIEQEEDLSPGEIKYLISMCKDDLYLFAVRYFPHYLKKPSSKLHKFLYNTLSRELSSKSLNKKDRQGVKWAIAAPRGGAKSTVLSCILPIWCMCYNKKKFMIIISDTADQAEDFLSDIKRELIGNLALARDFPHMIGKGSVWRQDEIITNNDIRIMALGTGSKIRGRKYGTDRPDIIIHDDLENMGMIRSKKEREFIRKWFDSDVMFAGEAGGTRTDFFVVGTVLSKDSLLNSLLNPEEYPGWKTRRFSAVIKHSTSEKWDEWKQIFKNRLDVNRKEHAREFFEKHKEEMLEGSEVLWPEGDSYYSLMEYFVSDPSGFYQEKQNSPFDPSKVYVKKEDLYFENFNTNPKIREAISRGKKRRLVFGGIDPSLGKKSSKGDPSAIATLIRDPETGLLFVVDLEVKRRSIDEQIDAILKYHDKRKYKLFGVETNAFQYVVAENLRKKSKKEGVYVPIVEINQYIDKKLRIEGIVPFLKDGTFVFDKYKCDNNIGYNLGIEQITTYTGEGDEADDAPDLLEMLFKLAKKPRFKMLTRDNKNIDK